MGNAIDSASWRYSKVDRLWRSVQVLTLALPPIKKGDRLSRANRLNANRLFYGGVYGHDMSAPLLGLRAISGTRITAEDLTRLERAVRSGNRSTNEVRNSNMTTLIDSTTAMMLEGVVTKLGHDFYPAMMVLYCVLGMIKDTPDTRWLLQAAGIDEAEASDLWLPHVFIDNDAKPKNLTEHYVASGFESKLYHNAVLKDPTPPMVTADIVISAMAWAHETVLSLANTGAPARALRLGNTNRLPTDGTNSHAAYLNASTLISAMQVGTFKNAPLSWEAFTAKLGR